MKNTVQATTFGVLLVLGWLFIGCEPSGPAAKLSAPAPLAAEDVTPGETLNDVVRRTLAEILRDDDGYSRARRLGTLLPTLGAEEIPTLRNVLEDATLDMSGGDIALLIEAWAIHQPEEATRWAVRSSPQGLRLDSVVPAMSRWALSDAKAAVSAYEGWSNEALPKATGDALKIGLVRGWFAADRDELTKYIAAKEAGIARQRLLASYVRLSLQRLGVEAALGWAADIPETDPIFKLDVFRQVASVLPLFDVDAAVRWCGANCDGPYGKDLPGLIARRWVLQDGPAALEWLRDAAPDGPETELAVLVTFHSWLQLDRGAAIAWMDEASRKALSEDDPWLQPAYPPYAQAIVGARPAEAIEWAERVIGDNDRELVLIRVAQAWRAADEVAAEAWLSESALSASARERVRSPGQKLR